MAEYLVTLSLLIIIVLLVRGFFRKSISPTVMYALWLVVVLRLCLPFPLFRVEMDLPAWQETIPQEDYGQQGAADPGIDPDTITPPVADLPSVPDTPSVIIPTTPVIPSVPSMPTVPSVPENPTVPGENPMPDVPVIPEEPPVPPTPIDWMRVAVTVWISGSAVLAVWFVITGIVYHYRLITHRTLYKTLRKTKVYITEDESAPCLAGVIPAIYIPPVEMDDDARAFIVLHEYMHLRHGDHVWAVVRILALIAHWWNPLVWAAVILSKRDAELACDHAVASQLNRENRLEYARILLDTIPQKHRYAVGLGSAPMKERILRLTKTQKNRILCVVLAVIITAAAVGCSFIGLKDREEGDGESTGDQSVVDEPIDDELIDDEPIDDEPIDDEPIDDEPIGIPLSGVLSCILRGEDAFHDTATKQRAYLTDWLKTNEMSVSKYSVIDLNGDGVPELVLWLNRGTNEHVGFLVLYDKNNTVYAHLLYYREFSDLKEDGTFDFSSGVSNHGIGRIDFEGDTYTIRKLAYCESADNQNVSYFVENKPVTKQAFDAYENAQNSKPDAVWVEHTIEAAPGYKQYTPAIDIDTAKLDYVKPMAMYGESQPQANYNRTANIYPGIGSEGYADGVGYITFGICNDRKSPDYVSRYYTYRVTSEGGYIISVDEVETITRDIVLKKGKSYTGSLDGQHICVVNNRYYGIAISGNTISASVGLYQTDAGGTGKGTYTYDPKTGEMTVTTITKYHDGNGNLLVNSPKTVTGKLYEYNDMVHFLYDDAKATPLPLSFPKVNAFPPDRTDFIFDDLAGGWYHSFRDEKGDQFYCLALDPETQQICFAHGFYDGSYAARYAGTYRVDYNRIIHATLQDNNDPDSGEMKFVFSMGYSMGRDETGEMRTTINITPQVCDMENYRPMLGRYFGFQREKFTTEELDEREEHYNFVMTAYEKAAEAAVTFYTAGSVDTTDSVWIDEETYFRVKGFDTPNDLRLYMESHFAPALIDQFLTGEDAAKYIQHEGKLYATPGILPESPRLGERYYSASKVTEDWYAVEVTVEVLDTKDLTTVLAYQSFQFDYKYKNGKWVFTGFPHIR